MDEKRKSCGGHGQRHFFFIVCFFFGWWWFLLAHGSSVGENQIWFADMTYYIIRLYIYIYVLCAYRYVTCPYTLIDTRVYKNIHIILLQFNAPKLPWKSLSVFFSARTFWVALGGRGRWPSQAIEMMVPRCPRRQLVGKDMGHGRCALPMVQGEYSTYSKAYYSYHMNVGEPMINWWWSFVVCVVEPKLCMSLQWNPFHKTFRCRILLYLQHQGT